MNGSDFYVVLPLDVLAMGPYQVAVYAALRSFADRGGECWPSYQTLASRAGISEKKVRLVLSELRDEGWIGWVSRRKDDGSLASNLYSIYGVRSGTPGGEGSGTPGGEGLGTGYQRTNNQYELQPIELRNPPNPPSQAVVHPITPGVSVFDEFWATYPRKAGKGAAAKAWKQATKRASPMTILAGVQRYAQDPNLPQDHRYVPHPATWLNGDRWEDDPMPAPPASNVDKGRALVAKYQAMGQ